MAKTRCKECKTVYEQGQRCPKCAIKRNQRYNKKRGAEVDFYNSRSWKSKRKQIIEYYCNVDIWILGSLGTIVPCKRTVVHHITTLSENRQLGLEDTNLVPVSTESHNTIHDYYDSGRREEAIEIINTGRRLYEALKNGDA